jgi:hypothetical protein
LYAFIAFLVSFTHFSDSILFNLSFSACSNVADKLMLSALVFSANRYLSLDLLLF